MAIQLKDTATIAAKWRSRASSAAPEYKSGVDTTTADWAGAAAAANDSYKEGVTTAIGRDAFKKGVTAAGTAKWRDKASNVGASRYGQGVAAGEGAYNSGFSPYAQTLSSLALPPRGPKGSPQNINRVSAVADALHRKKTGQ
jgi:hypothetical protein